jgi:AraC-like DNA-binding protein
MLVRYCKVVSEGKARYEDDWSDAKIAENVGASTYAVADLRREKFGELFCFKQKTAYEMINTLIFNLGSQADRITALERMVENLHKALAQDRAAHNKAISDVKAHVQELALRVKVSPQDQMRFFDERGQ